MTVRISEEEPGAQWRQCGVPAETHHTAFDMVSDTGATAACSASEFGASEFGANLSDEDDDCSTLRPRCTLDFEDRREELHRTGLLKWKLERGMPDVGGMGWRTKDGYLLKNQTYFSVKPKENLWDNPCHAGPKTWTEWHGPRLRNDAPLMTRLETKDVEMEAWEVVKRRVIHARSKALRKFSGKRQDNLDKEMMSHFAPRRKTLREVHSSYGVREELDTMPMKELRKTLTPRVIQGDKKAMEVIKSRIQLEESWKADWQQIEKDRREVILAAAEARKKYNDVITEMAGQLPRPTDPDHKMPNFCTPRLEELAKPTGPRQTPLVTTERQAENLIDFRGLVHVLHRKSLERMFPDEGYERPPEPSRRSTLRKSLRVSSAKRSTVGFTQPEPLQDTVKSDQTSAKRATIDSTSAKRATIDSTKRVSIVQEAFQQASLARRATLQPVIKSELVSNSERPNWRPKRMSLQSEEHVSAKTPGHRTLKVTFMKLSRVAKATRADHVGRFIICHAYGKPRPQVGTKVWLDDGDSQIGDLNIDGWMPGEKIVMTVIDRNAEGQDIAVATALVAPSTFFPNGFAGTVKLDTLLPLETQRSEKQPELDVTIEVQGDPAKPETDLVGDLSMLGAEPTLQNVRQNLDDFEKNNVPMPMLGNFWMTQSNRTTQRGQAKEKRT